MVEVHLLKPGLTDGELRERLVAAIRVDGWDFKLLSGSEEWGEIREIEIYDPEVGDVVSFAGDPERWARNLPHVFRAGDLYARVINANEAGIEARQEEEALSPALASTHFTRHAPHS